jgi:hypothetical protein
VRTTETYATLAESNPSKAVPSHINGKVETNPLLCRQNPHLLKWEGKGRVSIFHNFSVNDRDAERIVKTYDTLSRSLGKEKNFYVFGTPGVSFAGDDIGSVLLQQACHGAL